MSTKRNKSDEDSFVDNKNSSCVFDKEVSLLTVAYSPTLMNRGGVCNIHNSSGIVTNEVQKRNENYENVWYVKGEQDKQSDDSSGNLSEVSVFQHRSSAIYNASKVSFNFCRFCFEGDTKEILISPCHCSGSVGFIHKSCVEKWLNERLKDTCELCEKKYKVVRHHRPFKSWLCNNNEGDDRRNVLGDGICFLLLTPLAAISTYLCTAGAIYYFQEKNSESVGLLCLAGLLAVIYTAWFILTVRYHFQVWLKWKSLNVDIRLVDISSFGRVPSKENLSCKSEVIWQESIGRSKAKPSILSRMTESTCLHNNQTTVPNIIVDKHEFVDPDCSQISTTANSLHSSPVDCLHNWPQVTTL